MSERPKHVPSTTTYGLSDAPPVTPKPCPVTAQELREIAGDCVYAAQNFMKKRGDIEAYYAHAFKLRTLATWLEQEGRR